MKYKDYYKILELKDNHVTDEEIKNSYRKLAKKYHPDINPGNEVASEKFKDVNEAYQVLSDSIQKKKYNRIYGIYKIKGSFDDMKNNFNFEGTSKMMEIIFGKKYKINKYSKKYSKVIDGENLESQIDITIYEAFYGTEKKLAYKTIEGTMKNIVIKIPKGIKNGQKIRVAGQGKNGKNGGRNGDLILKINIMKDPEFEIKGNDIYTNLSITPWEAALGCKINVKNIDSEILINIPSGTQTGEKLKLANSGFWNENGGRGDLLVNIQIMVPKNMEEGEKLLFEKMAMVSHFEPRKNTISEKE